MGSPRFDVVRAWREMDLSVGAPRLDVVREWGLHRHIIALEWDNVTQVIVGSYPCEGQVMRGSPTLVRYPNVGAPRLDAVRAWGFHRHIITLEWDKMTQVNVQSDPYEGQVMRGSPTPRRRSSMGGDGHERGRPTP
jgi:hypothetical protein